MDAPVGSVGRTAREALEAGDLFGISMVLIDGQIRIGRSRNTPPAARAAEVVKGLGPAGGRALMRIRKLVTVVEEILEDGGRAAAKPVKKVAAVAVIENPFAGRFVEDLQPLIKTGEELGELLGRRAAAALGAPVHSYGKAAIVGTDGEYEHAAAILHPTLGTPFRAAVGGGKAIIPSAKKLGAPGTSIDVPLHFKDAAFVRTHFDAMEVRLPDAPRANEILVALVVTDGGRPHPRVGGLTVAEAKKEDGLR